MTIEGLEAIGEEGVAVANLLRVGEVVVKSNPRVWGWLYVSGDGDQTSDANEELRALRSSVSRFGD